jgi:hypothetical protein
MHHPSAKTAGPDGTPRLVTACMCKCRKTTIQVVGVNSGRRPERRQQTSGNVRRGEMIQARYPPTGRLKEPPTRNPGEANTHTRTVADDNAAHTVHPEPPRSPQTRGHHLPERSPIHAGGNTSTAHGHHPSTSGPKRRLSRPYRISRRTTHTAQSERVVLRTT